MWSRISSALKRPETPVQDLDADDQHLATILPARPSLSELQEPTEVPFPSPSPPASPSKHGRRGIFKRAPKTWADSDPGAQLPIKLPIPHVKSVKASLHTISTGSDASSIGRASMSSSQARQSQESNRPQDIARTPTTPTVDGPFGSLRSILRDRNTPATGQSVRFFSRDAYKVITPDVSNASASGSEPDPSTFSSRLKAASSTPVRPTLQDVFSPPPSSSLKPLPPPNDSNIFNLSQDFELPPIPISKDSHPLLDNAIEMPSDADTHFIGQPSDVNGTFTSATPPHHQPSGIHDRSHSFSFGQTVFHSLATGDHDSPISNASLSGSRSRGSLKPKGNRSRAYSDTVFHSFIQDSPSSAKDVVPPEADIDDRSSGALVLYPTPASPEKEKEKDPFGAHATAYYTPATGVPPTPPQSAPAHSRKASREEDLILSLRTQLALQTELCAQYEVDLRGRDELMRMQSSRLEEAERELERRKGVNRGWRKRVAELERCVHSLQDEVDRSREESVERSVMDEASGQALRSLHRRIGELEREKTTLEKRERLSAEELNTTRSELGGVKEELARRDETERELQDGIARAREQMETMDVSMQLEDAERSRVFSTTAWDEERQALTAANEVLRAEYLASETQLTDTREEVVRKDKELGVLKQELEAQWRSTEKQSERIAEVEKECDELRAEVEALNTRNEQMEEEWTQAENRKNELDAEVQELWAVKEELEKERSELEEQARADREHVDDLTHALGEREDKVSALEQEHKFALDRALRVETRLREREADLSDLVKKQSELENGAATAQSDIAQAKREHARIVNEQSRTLQDVVAREVEARAGMEAMVREKAETDVQVASLNERSNALAVEVERLRRQVHELQQESADKDLKVVQLNKQRAQDKDDLTGLNIALDSKQQELELLKRRLGVRGMAGGTPAPAAKAPAQRRESSIFGTPNVSRPPSVLSDSGSKDRRLSEIPSTAAKAGFGKSNRAIGTLSTTRRSVEGMGPPPSITRSHSATANIATATPTRIPSGGSARVTPSTIKAPMHQRRGSTSILEPSKLRASMSSREMFEKLEKLPAVPSASEQEEKENSAPTSISGTVSTTANVARRMTALPA